MEKEEIIRLSRAIQDIIIKSSQTRLRPKELMPDLIAQGFFKKDEKFGKPLRDVMNRLDKNGQLGLIPQVVPDRQEKAVYWYFEAADMPEPKPEKKKPVAKKAAPKEKTAKPAPPKATTVKKAAPAAKTKVAEKEASSKAPVKKPAVTKTATVKKAIPVKKVMAEKKVKPTAVKLPTKKTAASKSVVEAKVKAAPKAAAPKKKAVAVKKS